ncbi:uncharacterized protein Tco025E_02260, partial [Trypanosoma conorhini]
VGTTPEAVEPLEAALREEGEGEPVDMVQRLQRSLVPRGGQDAMAEAAALSEDAAPAAGIAKQREHEVGTAPEAVEPLEAALSEDAAPAAGIAKQREHEVGTAPEAVEPLEAALSEDAAPEAGIAKQREHEVGTAPEAVEPLYSALDEEPREEVGAAAVAERHLGVEGEEELLGMYDSTLKDVKKTRRRRKGANLMGAATSFASIPEEEVVYVADTDEALPGKPLYASVVQDATVQTGACAVLEKHEVGAVPDAIEPLEAALSEDAAPAAGIAKQREHEVGTAPEAVEPLEAALSEDAAPAAGIAKQREHEVGTTPEAVEPLEAALREEGEGEPVDMVQRLQRSLVPRGGQD